MEKQDLKKICSQISDIIAKTNNENVFENIITFFNLTSVLHDRIDEIYAIPIAQKRPNLFMRLFKRKKADEIEEIIRQQKDEKLLFFKAITNAGRWECGCNRSKKGETVTKQNVFFGAKIIGSKSVSIDTLEKYKSTEPKLYNAVASQMTNFIKNFDSYFDKTNWL